MGNKLIWIFLFKKLSVHPMSLINIHPINNKSPDNDID